MSMKRKIRKSIQLYESEWDYIQEKSQKSGLKPSTYIRNMALDGCINIYDAAEFARIYTALCCISQNINQIAKVANSTHTLTAEDLHLLRNYTNMMHDYVGFFKEALRNPTKVM